MHSNIYNAFLLIVKVFETLQFLSLVCIEIWELLLGFRTDGVNRYGRIQEYHPYRGL